MTLSPRGIPFRGIKSTRRLAPSVRRAQPRVCWQCGTALRWVPLARGYGFLPLEVAPSEDGTVQVVADPHWGPQARLLSRDEVLALLAVDEHARLYRHHQPQDCREGRA